MIDVLNKNFGKNILKKLIEVSGLENEEIYIKLNISEKHLKSWLDQSTPVSIYRLIDFAEKLDLTIKFSIEKKNKL